MLMADFAFYKDCYLGTVIPEKCFPSLAQRAGEVLARFQRIYRVTVPGEESLKMAVCAVAETLYAHEKHRGGVTAASVGEVSVHYAGDRQLHRELFEKAAIYLEISRGVAV